MTTKHPMTSDSAKVSGYMSLGFSLENSIQMANEEFTPEQHEFENQTYRDFEDSKGGFWY